MLDSVASREVGADRDTIQFVPLFIEDANRAHAVTVLRELPRDRGGAGFRALQVREILPILIHVHVAIAEDVKEVSHHRGDPLPDGHSSTFTIDQIDICQSRPWRQVRC